MEKIFSDIRCVVKDHCCIVGMGNYLKSDDAVGLYIVESIRKTLGKDFPVLNVEDVIEAYVFKIAEMVRQA